MFAIAGIYFKVDNRVSNLENRVAAISEKADHIDETGTRRSHETDTSQQVEIDDLTRRVNNHDAILNALVPKVERIDTNVLMMLSQQQLKQR